MARLAEVLRLDGGAALVLLALVVALDLWGIASTDPDFYLPEVFRPIALVVVALFLVAGLVPRAALRGALRALLALVVVAILGLEARSRFGPSDEGTVERTEDVLLRYRYKPGAPFGGDGSTHHINHLGLMDEEHAIPKPPSVLRVVVMSGSIANDGSIPFDQRFWRLLEGELTTALGRPVEVVNVSVHGYSEVQQVRLLEKVGLLYEPDVVVAAYMLTAASLQNGGYRRIGDSFFAFRFLPAEKVAATGTVCSMFAPFYDEYSFDLIVRNSFERLAMLAEMHHFRPLVAVLPVLEEFDDPVCGRLYDQIVRVAEESKLPTVRVVDAFRGESFRAYTKPGQRWDVCHPNPAGHARIAKSLSDGVRALLDQKSE